MEPWQTILLAFGGNAALLAVLGWLGKSLLDKLIVRDTKQFESDLKAKTDAEIERIKNELLRRVESYKVQLKKSEFLFQKEFEAASAFTAVRQSIHPGFIVPMMDWHDACDEIACNFGRIEKELAAFLSKHGAVLTDDERKILVSAMSDAGYGKFHIVDGEVDPDANTQAGVLYENLQLLEQKLVNRVRDQSSL